MFNHQSFLMAADTCITKNKKLKMASVGVNSSQQNPNESNNSFKVVDEVSGGGTNARDKSLDPVAPGGPTAEEVVPSTSNQVTVPNPSNGGKQFEIPPRPSCSIDNANNNREATVTESPSAGGVSSDRTSKPVDSCDKSAENPKDSGDKRNMDADKAIEIRDKPDKGADNAIETGDKPTESDICSSVQSYVDELLNMTYDAKKFTCFYCNACHTYSVMTQRFEDHIASAAHCARVCRWRDCVDLLAGAAIAEKAACAKTMDRLRMNKNAADVWAVGAERCVEVAGTSGEPVRWVCTICCFIAEALEGFTQHLTSDQHLLLYMEVRCPNLIRPPNAGERLSNYVRTKANAELIDKVHHAARQMRARQNGPGRMLQWTSPDDSKYIDWSDEPVADVAEMESQLTMDLMQLVFESAAQDYQFTYRRVEPCESVAALAYSELNDQQAAGKLGLQYLVELWAPGRSAAAVHYCALCDYLITDWSVHCSIMKHVLGYLQAHYKNVYDYVLREAGDRTQLQANCRIAAARVATAERRSKIPRVLHCYQIFDADGVDGSEANNVFVAINAHVAKLIVTREKLSFPEPAELKKLAHPMFGAKVAALVPLEVDNGGKSPGPAKSPTPGKSRTVATQEKDKSKSIQLQKDPDNNVQPTAAVAAQLTTSEKTSKKISENTVTLDTTSASPITADAADKVASNVAKEKPTEKPEEPKKTKEGKSARRHRSRSRSRSRRKRHRRRSRSTSRSTERHSNRKGAKRASRSRSRSTSRTSRRSAQATRRRRSISPLFSNSGRIGAGIISRAVVQDARVDSSQAGSGPKAPDAAGAEVGRNRTGRTAVEGSGDPEATSSARVSAATGQDSVVKGPPLLDENELRALQGMLADVGIHSGKLTMGDVFRLHEHLGPQFEDLLALLVQKKIEKERSKKGLGLLPGILPTPMQGTSGASSNAAARDRAAFLGDGGGRGAESSGDPPVNPDMLRAMVLTLESLARQQGNRNLAAPTGRPPAPSPWRPPVPPPRPAPAVYSTPNLPPGLAPAPLPRYPAAPPRSMAPAMRPSLAPHPGYGSPGMRPMDSRFPGAPPRWRRGW